MAGSLRRSPGATAGASPLLRLRASTLALTAEQASAALFALALTVGALIRLTAVAAGDGFPLNDGGMFLVMVEDIKANGLLPPAYTTYNGGDIPFAYPQLPFIGAATLARIGGWSSVDLLIVLPVVFSILTIPAFWLLARTMLGDAFRAGVATLFFVSIPRSFNWEIVGGGLTRSPGLFFATLAVWQCYELFQTGRKAHLLPAIVLASLAVLCHMEMGWFVMFTTLLFAARHRHSRHTLLHAALLAGGTALLTAPWYVTVLANTGPGPFLAAMQTGGHAPATMLSPLLLRFTDDVLFPLALALALLGVLVSLRDRSYLLPIWLVLIFLLDPRKAATLTTLPLAMLATQGLLTGVLPLIPRTATGRTPRWTAVVVGFLLLVYAPGAALLSATGIASPLHALPASQRDAMAWVSENTPTEARFAVVPSANRWPNDAPTEWFPALAGRVNLTTVQGSEWLGNSTYRHSQDAYQSLVDCAGEDSTCLQGWLDTFGDGITYVYVPKGETAAGRTWFNRQELDCCRSLIESLRRDPAYRLAFENQGAVIFERRAGAGMGRSATESLRQDIAIVSSMQPQ